MYKTDRMLPVLFYNRVTSFMVSVEVFTGIFLDTFWAAKEQE